MDACSWNFEVPQSMPPTEGPIRQVERGTLEAYDSRNLQVSS